MNRGHRRVAGRLPPDQVGTPRPRTAVPPLRDVLLVAAGGTIGALARAGLSEVFPVLPSAFPWTTFAENISGAFALAVVLTLMTERVITRPQVRLAVCTGALGAFTTYSALAGEATDLLARGRVLLSVGYALGSAVAGIAAALAGARLGRAWAGSRQEPR